MREDRFERTTRIFEAARILYGAPREEFLDKASVGDAPLREEVERDA